MRSGPPWLTGTANAPFSVVYMHLLDTCNTRVPCRRAPWDPFSLFSLPLCTCVPGCMDATGERMDAHETRLRERVPEVASLGERVIFCKLIRAAGRSASRGLNA